MLKRELFKKNAKITGAMLIALSLGFSACDDDVDDLDLDEEVTGSLSVEQSQFLAENNNQIMVNTATISDDGWVVVRRADDNGQPGEIIATQAVSEGTSDNIMISLNSGEELSYDESFIVTLHEDTGVEGTFEYDGSTNSEDMPVMMNNVAVSGTSRYWVPAGGTSSTYALGEMNSSGVSGNATVYRGRDNTTSYVVFDVDGGASGSMYSADVFEGSMTDGGTIRTLDLNDIDGTTGQSITPVTNYTSTYNNGGAVTYDDLVGNDSYFSISDDSDNVVASGDFGESDD